MCCLFAQGRVARVLGAADAGRHLLRRASSQAWRQAATSAQAALTARFLLLPNPISPRNPEAAAESESSRLRPGKEVHVFHLEGT